jgi:hypothetical protein
MPARLGVESLRRQAKGRELLTGEQTDMHRHAQRASERQIPLDLDPMAHPARESALRAAYVRLQLSGNLTFEQVMSDPAYAIGIRNLAHAMARRRTAASITDARASHQLNRSEH